MVLDINDSGIRIKEHPQARNKAVASRPATAGTVLLAVPALSTALSSSEKGRRCDNCHRSGSEAARLRKCTGCASYWYCGAVCQSRQWSAHHKRICKHFPRYVASAAYQALSSHDQVDAVLLSHLLVEVSLDGRYHIPLTEEGPIAVFMDLMKGPAFSGTPTPPVCSGQREPDATERDHLASELYQRFGNNNFVLHSHLNSYAHGIFPLASRLFNHSCAPNSATKFIITPSEHVRMEVVALRDVVEGEEITIPYLDPALPVKTRREALRLNYGFVCTCPLCRVMVTVHPTSPPHRGSQELEDLERKLREYVFGDADGVSYPLDGSDLLERMPTELASVLHESYLPQLSEIFSRTSHQGPYSEALRAGATLLALYILVYPLNYPQIGMHALELAKTAWNAVVTHTPGLDDTADLERTAIAYINIAVGILLKYGPEGDEGGPLEEVRVLQGMLAE